MRQVDPKVYSKDYYLNACLGYEEFKLSKGRKVHPRIRSFVESFEIKKGMYILDLGCGRGDIAIEYAKKGAVPRILPTIILSTL